MTIIERIKERIINMEGLEKLDENPNSTRLTFINDEQTIKEQKIEEYRMWYIGDSDELLNYYTNRELSGNAREPIYNRNKPNYFWGIASGEQPFKKVHSGVPRQIIDTICNVLDVPVVDNELLHDQIKDMLEKNNFAIKLTQEARPLTLVEGYGAWKINYNKKYSDQPIFLYYEAKDVHFVQKSGIIIGVIFVDYYKVGKNDFVMFETRRVDNTNSYIEFELYRLGKDNDCTKVPLNTIKGFEEVPENGYIIPGINKILAVPTRYFHNMLDKSGGRSVFEGKLDIFDDIDQCLSTQSIVCKDSVPLEYIPVDMLSRDAYGRTELPSVYCRQFVAKDVIPNGDGASKGEVQVTQPQLNIDQYASLYHSLIDVALIGILSPASMGFDVSLKDNATAQREKEKITIYTRNNIKASETQQIKDLVECGLIIKEFMDKGSVSVVTYDISVKYKDFANPTFEGMSEALLPLWNAGGISTKMYIDKLYGDSLSEEEKEREIEELEKQKNADNMNLGDFGLDDDKEFIKSGTETEAKPEETTKPTEE